MIRLFVLAAVVCAVFAALIGFGQWDAQADHVLGWLAASLAFYLASDLLELMDR